MIKMIDPAELYLVWDIAKEEIKRPLGLFDYGSDLDDIRDDIMTGHRQLWQIGDDAWAITSLSNTNQFRTLDIQLLAGSNMDQWLESFFERMQEFGKEWNCKYMDGFGRKGWARKLEQFGFKPYSYDVRCKIDGWQEQG